MKGNTAARIPLSPQVDVLSHSPIPTAGDVPEDTIKYSFSIPWRAIGFGTILLRDKVGEELGIVASDNEPGRLDTFHLVGQHVRPPRVGIVRYDHAFRDNQVVLASKRLKQLGSFPSGGTPLPTGKGAAWIRTPGDSGSPTPFPAL